MDKYLSTKTITLAGTMRRINLPPMRCITPPPMVEARLTSPLSPPSFSLWLILAPAAVFYYSHPVITLAQMPANISPPQPNQQKSPLPESHHYQKNAPEYGNRFGPSRHCIDIGGALTVKEL